MNRSDDETLSDIDRRLPAARKAIDEARGNLPSNGPQNGSGGVCTNGGPTARLATEHISGHPDPADQAETNLIRLVAILNFQRTRRLDWTDTARRITQILDVWAPTAEQDKQRTENLRAASDDLLNRIDHNNCQSHLRIGSVEPARTEGSKLCRWCEDWVRALNDPDGDWGDGVRGLELDMPPLDMVRARVEGRKIDRHIPPRRRSRTSC